VSGQQPGIAPKTCECGCGALVISKDPRPSRRRRFIRGHNSKLLSANLPERPVQPPPNPSGVCMCGCGQPVPRAKLSRGSNQVADEFLRYLRGHWPKWEARRNPVKPDDPRGPNPSGKCQCGCGGTVTVADRTDAARQVVAGCYVRFLKGHDKITVPRVGGTGKCFCGCGLDTPIAKQAKLGNIAGKPQMYYPGHRQRLPYKINCETGCGEMRARHGDGYTRVRRNGRLCLGHVWFWEELHGPVPDGFELDHLCRNRGCVNPAHLEKVTHEENVRRIHAETDIPQWAGWDEIGIAVDKVTGCWIFPVTQADGYARIWMRKNLLMAHRLFYEREFGKIPDGLELDHKCLNRACVSPDHLEPVTHLENVRRIGRRRNGLQP